MARARNIKPGFFTNDRLADIDPLGRILFIGLWTIADREGRLEDRPRKIKAEVLPYDDADADDLLNQLERQGFITRYETDENQYIQILNFTKHQNPHVKESASTIPAPYLTDASTMPQPDTNSINPADSLNPITDSPLLIPDSLEGAAKADATPPKPKRKTKVPDDFTVTDELESWGGKQTPPFSVSSMQAEIPAFVDYYRAHGKPMADWHATFQNWMRRNRKWERDRTAPRPMKPIHNQAADLIEQARREREEYEQARGNRDSGGAEYGVAGETNHRRNEPGLFLGSGRRTG